MAWSERKSCKNKDYSHIPPEVPNVKLNFDVRFLTLMHRGNIKKDKLGSFVREETYTILT